MIDIINFVEFEELQEIKKYLKDGENKIVYSDDNIKITLKKRGRKIYTFIDEFKNNSNINNILQNIKSLV